MLNRTMRKLTRLTFNLERHHLRCSYCVVSNSENTRDRRRTPPVTFRTEILNFFQKNLSGEKSSAVAKDNPANEFFTVGTSPAEPSGTLIKQYLSMYNVSTRGSSPTKYKDILQDLNTLVRKLPRTLMVLPCYAEAIDALCKGLEEGKLNKEETVQLLYFISLKKKKVGRHLENVLAAIRPLDELSMFEKCIIAECCYKTGTKLKPEDLKPFEHTLKNNIEDLLKDKKLLVTLCKIVRSNKPSWDLDLSEIGVHIANWPKRFETSSAVHILQLYAEIYHFDRQVLQRLIRDIVGNYATYNNLPANVRHSSTDQFVNYVRKIKYLDALLWSLYRLGYQLEEKDYNVIFTYMDSIYNTLKEQPVILLRVLLCLWALGIRMEETVMQLFRNPKALKAINDDTWKTLARLDLLKSCVQIEAPYLNLNYQLPKPLNIQPQVSRSINTVHKIISMISKQMPMSDIRLDCPVRGISIVGVTCIHSVKGKIHIDVLDDTNCLRYTRNPHGILKLKIRLLKVLGYHSVLIKDQQLVEPVSAFVHVEDQIIQTINCK